MQLLKEGIDFDSFLKAYDFQVPYEVENRESGMNNTTRIINAGSERFVLRIYNNHRDPAIVRLEHEVLAALDRRDPPFRVPSPVRDKKGETVGIAGDGTVSALYRYIEGERPDPEKPAHVFALGRTAALLTSAMSRIEPAGAPLYSPYYELEDTYAAMDERAFLALPESFEALAPIRVRFAMLQKEREGLREAREAAARLPKQWIHGDLVFNNTVAQGDEIVGVLDFEFSTKDARAMELAVIVADLLKPDDPGCGEKIGLLLGGYRESFRLSEEERRLLPALMKLRLLDVALHFAVRLRDGLDREDVLSGIIEQTAFGCGWINEYWEDEWL
ncbi:phosphotransferase [Paenibacillus arenilitoris]|uniref:Phosphotransferase n=1 Tax=Paenibacillus arenilitoris TaxID=2772299 RepID=A0A927CKJ4_9BACL|nr:phosphotransferase [Paenibacillus arenilitoris]MBD2869773.1 phosphotransferase [Paenibacillus arenilitoris]